jgi:hypothetical protein
VEIVATIAAVPPYNGTVAAFRGDGQDTGDGDAVLWSQSYPALAGFAGLESIGAPAIGDLDGEFGAEVVVAEPHGVHVYHADGSLYWFTDTVTTFRFFAAPAIGNLDLEPLPEVVVTGEDTLAVFEHDGTLAWSHTDLDGYFNPVLADLTGDGLLDILAHDGDDTLYLWDYGLGTPVLAWSTVLSSAMSTYGGPAVADIDGQQPGGDAGPEVAVVISGTLRVLEADGSAAWTAPLAPGRPGSVSIADLNGDGEIDILASSLITEGVAARLYAFNADGTMLWATDVEDNSPANASLMDLDGDGAYEVAHIGPGGLSLIDGTDGSLLFSETGVTSLTGLDFSISADVDQDGYGELVVPAQGGLRVFGWDGVWTEARPLWNQLSYHVTNINDDLSVPQSEPNSWESHNTFRTQYPAAAVLPVYDVSVLHTAGGGGVAVLTDTFNVSPTVSADPAYGWDYTQTWEASVITRTFETALTDLQPGEARMVAAGTAVSYTLPSGVNALTLPPLYVSVPHIISLAPEAQTVGAGGVVTFAVGLSNPAAAGDTYDLAVSGVPPEWAALPAAVPMDPFGAVTMTLTISVPAGTVPGAWPVAVSAVNQAGGTDQAHANLEVEEGITVDVSPASQSAAAGAAVTYTLAISNHEGVARTYDLAAFGLAAVTLPATVTVPAGDSAQLDVVATAASEGPHPFTIAASHGGAAAADSALLVASGLGAVGIDLDPAALAAGPGSTALYTVTVTNLGSAADTYNLSVDVPAGWTAELSANGTPVGAVALPPDLFNSAEVRLAVRPSAGAAPGVYPVEVTAQSQSLAGVSALVAGTLEVLPNGVQVALSPTGATLDPNAGGVWQVTITNTGSVADVFDLSAGGIVALSGQFSENAVALDPGAVTSVQLTTGALEFALPGTYPIAVAAVSQDDDRARDEATATVTFEAFEAVALAWSPASQSVPDNMAGLVLVITNTANSAATYALSLDMPGLIGAGLPAEVALPAGAVVMVPVFVTAAAPGTYMLEAGAASTASAAEASATASVTFDFEAPPPAPAGLIYLPLLKNGPDTSPALPFRTLLPLVMGSPTSRSFARPPSS